MSTPVPRNVREWRQLANTLCADNFPNIAKEKLSDFRSAASAAAANADLNRWNLYSVIPAALLLIAFVFLRFNAGVILWGASFLWGMYCMRKGLHMMRSQQNKAVDLGRKIGIFD
ncbi:MAG: hypothetical protein IAE80_07965 [Anaerolinea sp.]|nr:hypothetical protein [Anaerolinea sp.]